jgi:nucleotide-binding universal stress UspA family protein
MRRILVPIDDGAPAEAAVRRLAAGATGESVGRIHLLTVQPVLDGYVRRFIDRAAIRRFEREEGERALAGPRRILEAARVPYAAHIRSGELCRTILETATELGVDEIAIGAEEIGPFAALMKRAHAARLARRTSIPVRLIEPPWPAAAEAFPLAAWRRA